MYQVIYEDDVEYLTSELIWILLAERIHQHPVHYHYHAMTPAQQEQLDRYN